MIKKENAITIITTIIHYLVIMTSIIITIIDIYTIFINIFECARMYTINIHNHRINIKMLRKKTTYGRKNKPIIHNIHNNFTNTL